MNHYRITWRDGRVTFAHGGFDALVSAYCGTAAQGVFKVEKLS